MNATTPFELTRPAFGIGSAVLANGQMVGKVYKSCGVWCYIKTDANGNHIASRVQLPVAKSAKDAAATMLRVV